MFERGCVWWYRQLGCSFLTVFCRRLGVQGKYKEAKENFLLAEKTTKDTLGENHPDYSKRLNDFAWFLQQQVRSMPGS